MFSISLNHVHDQFKVQEGNEIVHLRVDCDPRTLVYRIRSANEKIVEANKETSSDDDRRAAARAFSEAMFGKEQTDMLADLYNDDYSCVMTICGLYFEQRLSKKIAQAQKRQK